MIPFLQLILLLISLGGAYNAARFRAEKEAAIIRSSKKDQGLWWHIKMWTMGKAPYCLLLVAIFVSTFYRNVFSVILWATLAHSLLLLAWYSLWFDQYLSLARGKERWYVSFYRETALSDKFLRELMWRFSWSQKQVHLYVKVPLLLIGFGGCVYLIFNT
jgi:hypothetical protein